MTFADILDRLCEMEGSDFDNMSEAQKKLRVGHVNAALRWAWRTDDPLFAFPFTVTTATVNVTAGLVALASLGEGTWCSLWTADPRPASSSSTARPVQARVSQTGAHPLTEETSVFAFYRSAVPQGTYAPAGAYATPASLSENLLEIVALKALHALFVSLKQWEALAGLRASYDDPRTMKDSLAAALQNSGLVWQQHALALK